MNQYEPHHHGPHHKPTPKEPPRGLDPNLRALYMHLVEHFDERFDVLVQMGARAHAAEMAKIDADTNALSAQLAEMISNGPPTDLVPRLQSIAERLSAIGKQSAPQT